MPAETWAFPVDGLAPSEMPCGDFDSTAVKMQRTNEPSSLEVGGAEESQLSPGSEGEHHPEEAR